MGEKEDRWEKARQQMHYALDEALDRMDPEAVRVEMLAGHDEVPDGSMMRAEDNGTRTYLVGDGDHTLRIEVDGGANRRVRVGKIVEEATDDH